MEKTPEVKTQDVAAEITAVPPVTASAIADGVETLRLDPSDLIVDTGPALAEIIAPIATVAPVQNQRPDREPPEIVTVETDPRETVAIDVESGAAP
jgi:hypothetical protein